MSEVDQFTTLLDAVEGSLRITEQIALRLGRVETALLALMEHVPPEARRAVWVALDNPDAPLLSATGELLPRT